MFLTKCISAQCEGLLLKVVARYWELLGDWCLESCAHLPGVGRSEYVKVAEKSESKKLLCLK